ncbi:MAG: beta-ketoacyl synthase N-terminal-like domain-containing protein [Phycisphaerales bacterium]
MPDAEGTRRTDDDQRIVLTGIGLCTSLGADAESTWRAILSDRVGIGPMTEIESPLPIGSEGGQAAALPPDYRPDLPREARALRWTIEHALADGGIKDAYRSSGGADRRCVMLGTTLHGLRAGGRFLRSGRAEELRMFLAGATAAHALAGLGLEGGCATTCSACSSSLGAVALGATLLQCGRADLVVAGGYDAISEYSWGGFNALRLIAPAALRPFCVGRQGMKVAEGYGIVILERAASARARGARAIACLSGWGESADAYHLTKPHPGGEGPLAAMHAALAQAGIAPGALGLITAHATGTSDNDAAEFAALSALLGPCLSAVPVVAHKSRLGHTLGGAGAIELALAAMTLRDQLAPTTANITPADVEFDGLRVPTGPAVEREINHTLNISLGFGGANTCVVLSHPGTTPAPPAAPAAPAPFAHMPCITGMGILLPGAIGLAEFAVRAGQAGRTPPYTPLSDAALAEFSTARRARRMSPCVRYALAAAELALRDAALLDDHARLATASCLLGSMHGSIGFCTDYYSQIVREGVLAANPVLFAEGVPNAPAAHMSTAFRIQGSCQIIIGARTAGLDALALAALRVQSGASRVVLVVATEEQSDTADAAYTTLGLRANTRGAPTGFTSSHGAVAFVVEEAASAAARGAQPWARLGRSAAAFLGPAGVPRAVARVLERLGAPTCVVASSNGTWLDRAEAAGIRHRCRSRTQVLSATAAFGELFAATPLAGIAQSLIARPGPGAFTSLCTDWNGPATAMNIEPVDRPGPGIG